MIGEVGQVVGEQRSPRECHPPRSPPPPDRCPHPPYGLGATGADEPVNDEEPEKDPQGQEHPACQKRPARVAERDINLDRPRDPDADEAGYDHPQPHGTRPRRPRRITIRPGRLRTDFLEGAHRLITFTPGP